MTEGSLWGDLSNLPNIRTPKTILMEQASYLNQATGGVIRAEVSTGGSGVNLTHSLEIIAPVLNNYRYTAALVVHDVHIYPCKLSSQINPQFQECKDEEDLKVKLAAILSSDKMRRIIQSLLSQSTG